MEATPEELLEFLIDSARYGDTEDVELAIREKVQIDGQDSAGRTGVCTPPQAGLAVHAPPQTLEAALWPRLCCINLHAIPLVAAAIAALHMASANGHVGIVRLLLEANAVSHWCRQHQSWVKLRPVKYLLCLVRKRTCRHIPADTRRCSLLAGWLALLPCQ